MAFKNYTIIPRMFKFLVITLLFNLVDFRFFDLRKNKHLLICKRLLSSWGGTVPVLINLFWITAIAKKLKQFFAMIAVAGILDTTLNLEIPVHQADN